MFKVISVNINHCKSVKSATSPCPLHYHSTEIRGETSHRFVILLLYMSQSAVHSEKHPNTQKKRGMLFKERLSQDVVELTELLRN